jgi:kynurenine formamidase
MSTTRTLDAGAPGRLRENDVRRAVTLVREGRVFDLAHVLDEHVPAFPGREFHQCLTMRATTPVGRNEVSWIVEMVSAPSQIGTHVDGLNHLHRGGRMYGGHRVDEVTTDYGTTRNGIEQMPQIVTRGVLLDVAEARGVTHLGPGDVVTPADAQAALARIGLQITPGDAVLFHTGWGTQWEADSSAYAAGEPGPGIALAEWLVERGVVVTGCDTWSYGPVPPEAPDEPFVVPQTLNVTHGVVVIENLRLAELAAARAGEFLFVMSHAKLRGATGAWVAPLAIT